MEVAKLANETNIENMVYGEIEIVPQNMIHEIRGPTLNALDSIFPPENQLFEDVVMENEFLSDAGSTWAHGNKIVFDGLEPRGNQATELEKGYQNQRPACLVQLYSQRDDGVPQSSLSQGSSSANFDNFEGSLRQDFGNDALSRQSQMSYSYHQSQSLATRTNNLNFENTTRENNVPVPIKQSVKTKKRRRKTTPAQRKAANVRERRRMFSLNDAFDHLRKKVPTFDHETKLSRIETLRLAVRYIGFMTDQLQGH